MFVTAEIPCFVYIAYSRAGDICPFIIVCNLSVVNVTTTTSTLVSYHERLLLFSSSKYIISFYMYLKSVFVASNPVCYLTNM